MIARQQDAASGGDILRAMAEPGRRGGEAERPRSGHVRDLPERNQHPHRRQCGQRGLEIITAGGDLAGLGLVGGRQAFDGVQDHRAPQLQAIAGTGAVLALRQAEFEQGRVEQVASEVTGERPPGAVRTMLARRETDDRQPRVGVAERGNRRVPPVRVLAAAFLSKRHQPRAQRAVARRLRLRDGRKVGGLCHEPSLRGTQRRSNPVALSCIASLCSQ